MKKLLKSEALALCILIMITLPIVVHTRTLLLEITRFDGPGWLREVYAFFFAVAFDCSIFMFAVYGMKRQAAVFAGMSFIVGFMFWNNHLLFVELSRPGANMPELWSKVFIGTLWSGFSAYLVYWCSEMFARRLNQPEDEIKDTLIKNGANKDLGQNLKQLADLHVNHIPLPELRPKPKPRPKVAAPAAAPEAATRAARVQQLKATGQSNKEIAEAVGISEKTVERDLKKVTN